MDFFHQVSIKIKRKTKLGQKIKSMYKHKRMQKCRLKSRHAESAVFFIPRYLIIHQLSVCVYCFYTLRCEFIRYTSVVVNKKATQHTIFKLP